MRAVLVAAVVAISAVALAGCGRGGAASAGQAAGSRSSTGSGSASRTATATATSSTSTSATSATVAQVLPGTGRPAVAIGDKNFTEQFILGELYEQALTAEGFNATLTDNIGPTSVSLQAMKDGTLGLYPEYLNVWNSVIAQDPTPFSKLSHAYAAGRAWAAARGLLLLAPTPFSDTAGIAVTHAYALDNRLRTLYSLRRVATTLTLGAPLQFQTSASGLPAIEQTYGFVPAVVQSLNIGDQYAALSADSVQAAYVNTTDGELSSFAYSLLADPRHAFGFGNVVPVVSDSVIAAEGPAFAGTIDQVDALLSTSVMRELNAEVDIEHETPAKVARQFLQNNGLLAPSAP